MATDTSGESRVGLRLELLGGFRLTINGEPFAVPISNKAAALLVYLAVTRRPHSRDSLAALLWGEFPDADARASLRVALSGLQKAIGPYLIAGRSEVSFNRSAPYSLDVEEFESALSGLEGQPAAEANDRRGRALRLYHGEFLEGFAVRGSPDFDDWAGRVREGLRSLQVRALAALAAGLAGGHEDAAEDALSRLLAADPWREDAHRALMLLLASRGRRNTALLQYARCRRILRDELGVEPEAETVELAEKIRRCEFAPARYVPSAPPPVGAATAAGGSAPQREISGSVPAPPTPLLGRESELEEIVRLLTELGVRLLTLHGPGGMGKTRLALEAAASLAQRHTGTGGDVFPDGVWFVPLAPIADAGLVAPAIAGALGLEQPGGQGPMELLADWLRPRRLLLLLDNLEHLPDAAPQVAALLAASPGLKVLATSRTVLRLRGEHEFPVSSLELPGGRGSGQPSHLAPQSILGCASVALFTARARQADPRFKLDDRNAATVAEICRRLDGLPLAIELAAARVKLLPPGALLARLGRRLPVLTGGALDLPERHRTMRACIDWSVNLLGEAERRFFARLAVFVGGCTLDAAEAVAEPDPGDKEDALLGLSHLIDSSLLRREDDPSGEPRIQMLGTIREYAAERLEADEEADTIRRRHAQYYLKLSEWGRIAPAGERQSERTARIEAEHDNFRAALRWALSAGELQTAVQMGWNLWGHWYIRGHHREGRRWMEEALATPDLSPELRATALVAAAMMAYAEGDYGAHERYSEEGLTLAMRVGDGLRAAYSLLGLGSTAMRRGDLDAAEVYFQRAIPLFRECDEHVIVPLANTFLGLISLMRGDHTLAEVIFEEALAEARRLQSLEIMYQPLFPLAQTAQLLGDWQAAAERFREAATLALEMGDRSSLAHCLEGLAVCAGAQGHARRSAQLLGASEELLATVDTATAIVYKPDHALYASILGAVREELGEAEYSAATTEGRALIPDEALACALEGEPGRESGTY
jgi:predicted ATPase/DNA-binding SARP family transcriptional activator